MLEITAYGRVATDIEVAQSQDKKHLYTNFLVATHYGKDTTFIRCAAFDGLATLLENFFAKGDRILLKGNLIPDNYQGVKERYKLIVKNFEFVETKEEHNKNLAKHPKKQAKSPIKNQTEQTEKPLL